MLIPNPITPGSHIRVISPGLPTLSLIPERARRADRALRALGFEISYGAHAFSVSSDGITAGTAGERAEDFMDAFADDSVDAILTSDSGLGSRELLALLDPDTIAAHPKPFIGYCDTVFIHQYLASCVEMSSFYGCVLMVHFGEGGGPFPETVEYFLHALTSADPLICRPVSARIETVVDLYSPGNEGQARTPDIPGGWTWLRGGRCQGPLFGGEISVVPEVVDYFQLQLDGAVLFWDLESHNEQPARPQFEELCRHARLADLAGMIVGANARQPPALWAETVNDIVQELLPGTEFPILVNADLSHLCPSWTVPYGEKVVLDSAQGVIFPRTG